LGYFGAVWQWQGSAERLQLTPSELLETSPCSPSGCHVADGGGWGGFQGGRWAGGCFSHLWGCCEVGGLAAPRLQLRKNAICSDRAIPAPGQPELLLPPSLQTPFQPGFVFPASFPVSRAISAAELV